MKFVRNFFISLVTKLMLMVICARSSVQLNSVRVSQAALLEALLAAMNIGVALKEDWLTLQSVQPLVSEIYITMGIFLFVLTGLTVLELLMFLLLF